MGVRWTQTANTHVHQGTSFPVVKQWPLAHTPYQILYTLECLSRAQLHEGHRRKWTRYRQRQRDTDRRGIHTSWTPNGNMYRGLLVCATPRRAFINRERLFLPSRSSVNCQVTVNLIFGSIRGEIHPFVRLCVSGYFSRCEACDGDDSSTSSFVVIALPIKAWVSLRRCLFAREMNYRADIWEAIERSYVTKVM